MPRTRNKTRTPTQTPQTFRFVGGRVASDSKPATVTTAAPAVHVRPAPGEEQVRELAYRNWEAAGRPPGDGVPFWLDAERELAGR